MNDNNDPSKQALADWQHEDRLFEELLNLASERRKERLAQIASDSPDMANRLDRLLSAAEQQHPTVSLSELTLSREAFDALADQKIPDQIGAWAILRRIGHGGMAQVFEASREVSGGSQRAAIKILSSGINNEWASKHFEQEIGILGRLEDPRLSRLIDWGLTDQQLPWLAMEYVDGEQIDQACDEGRMTLKSRVEAMIQVIHAVAHAHQQLIVHGDLKPSNILLNRSGHVRLLDFGIATLGRVEGDGLDAGVQAFTLTYASPEQLRGQRIGPASDIFQLGLLLCRVLTGQSPFGPNTNQAELRLATIQAGAESISSLFSSMSTEQARLRNSKPAKLARMARGDLDAIVSKALSPEPSERYGSAQALADDLERWLQKRPVHARGVRLRDRIRCFLRRNSLATSAAAILFGLISTLIISTIQHNLQLTIERDVAQAAQFRSESMHTFMLEIFGTVDPNLQESRGKTVDELLIEGVERVRSQFSDDPETAAMLLFDFAGLLERRSRYEDSIDAYQEAHALTRERLGPGHPHTLDIISPGLSGALLSAGQFDQAHSLLEQARNHLPSDQQSLEPVHVEIWLSTATAHSRIGNYEQGIEATHQADALLQQLRQVSPADPDTLAQMDEMKTHIDHQLGALFAHAGDWEAAEPLLRISLERFEDQFGIEDNRSQIVRMNWAASLRELGHYEEAKQELERLLQAQEALHRGPHMSKAYTLGHLANLSSSMQDYQKAVDLWQAVADETRRATDANHPFIQRARMAQGRDLLRKGDCAQGRALLEEVAARSDLPANTIESAQIALQEITCQQTPD